MSYSHFISFTKVDDLFRSFRSKRLRVILYFIIIFFLQGTAQDKTHTLHSCLVLFFWQPGIMEEKTASASRTTTHVRPQFARSLISATKLLYV